jgi:ribonuclease G
MTRKRVKQSLERTMCAPCEYFEGAGWVKSPTTVCYEILAEARRMSRSLDDVRHTTLRVHPDVSKALRGEEHEVLEEIEAYLGTTDIAADRSVHPGQFDFAFV